MNKILKNREEEWGFIQSSFQQNLHQWRGSKARKEKEKEFNNLLEVSDEPH